MIRWISWSITLPEILSTFALCSVFAQVTDAAVILSRGHHENLPQQRAALHLRDTACGIPGNPEIYGLGIRLSLYMFWIATIFTYEFLEDEVSSAVDILLCMFFGGFWSLDFPSRAKYFSIFGLAIRFYLMAGMAAYALWLWSRGVDKFRQQPCGSQVFLFAKVSLFGHARIFFKIASVVNFLIPALYLSFVELFLFLPGLISFSAFLVIVPPIVVIWVIVDLCRGKISTWKENLSEIWIETELWQGMIKVVVMFTKPGAASAKVKLRERVSRRSNIDAGTCHSIINIRFGI